MERVLVQWNTKYFWSIVFCFFCAVYSIPVLINERMVIVCGLCLMDLWLLLPLPPLSYFPAFSLQGVGLMSPSSLLLISHQGVRSSCGVWERKRLQPCAPELDEASEKTEVKEIKGSVERQLIVKCIKGLENMSKERKKSGEVKIKWAARMEKSTQGWRQRLVLHTEYLCFPIAVLVSLS